MISSNITNFLVLDQLYTQNCYSFINPYVLDINSYFDFYLIDKYITEIHTTWIDSSFLSIEDANSINGTVNLHEFVLDSAITNPENLNSIYHYSIPTTKLFYPEPFIAAASFMHSDLWFMHILVYQYWLWFVFIFIVVFFIITFLCIVRWCNMRVRPRRETRGVSRSKCGDLITAIVPVSWAASIIISESTDAIDYFDGFGTTEMVIGIRAYQWGWEYYYPKDIDLNYNVKKNHSAFFGRSLKYNRTAETNLSANKAWKFYQNKPYDFVVTPAHLLLIPADNYKLLNYLNFSDVGTNAFHDSSLFKHTRILSKTFNSNLLFTPADFSVKYKTLAPLFVTDFDLQDSYLYGLKRQHNFLNTKVVTNNFSTLFNLKNANKLFDYNYNCTLDINKTFKGKHQINFFKSNQNNFSNTAWLISQASSNLYFNELNPNLSKRFTYVNLLDKLNNDSDVKKFKASLKKLAKTSPRKLNLNSSQIFKSTSNLTNSLVTPTTFTNQFFLNNRLTKKLFVSFSSNQFISKPGQSPKILANLSARRGVTNLSQKTNSASFFSSFASKNLNFSPSFVRSGFKMEGSEPTALFKLLNNKMYFDAPTPSFISNKVTNSLLNFDKYTPAEEETTFSTFQSDEAISPDYIHQAYWNLYLSQTDLSWRLQNSSNFNKFHNAFYLPFFTFGKDYDFQNWQGFSYLEDAYWENLSSVYATDDYFMLSDAFEDYVPAKKATRLFNLNIRKRPLRDDVAAASFLEDVYMNFAPNTPFVYGEETLVDTGLLPTWQFATFPIATNNILLEESFEYLKSLHYFYFLNLHSGLTYLTNSLMNNSNIFVLDNFRSNAEDFSWYDNEKITPSEININHTLDFDRRVFRLADWNKQTFTYIFKEFDYISNPLFKQYGEFLVKWRVLKPSFLTDFDAFDFQKTTRFSNFFNVRAPTRSAIGIYNSYQKVYKPRLDENRSHAKATDIAHLAVKQPNITAPKARLERSLGKNRISYFQNVTYKNELLPNFNVLYDAFNSLNYYFFDYPFLMGMKSDISRYVWTDWFSRWGMIEVQPASSSRYALMGMPFSNKSFDYAAEDNKDLVDTESYFIRIARARRNFLPTWTHIPYYYTKNAMFYRDNMFFEAFSITRKSFSVAKNFLNMSSWYWKETTLLTPATFQFIGSHSNAHTYGRASWTAPATISAYYNLVTNIQDALTKREYLYREFLATKKNVYRLETFMSNNPNNPLLHDIKAVFMLTNPTTFNMEYSRELYYSSLEFFNFTYIKPSIIHLFRTLGVPVDVVNTVLTLNEKSHTSTKLSQNNLLKSQYKPMRRGVTNMIRLHGTGAVAMPIEIRLQVLASSKDVIHSWSIPSAGVKIDCVPGYSSHRVIIFLVSGIFWGQCMEVCGRYHHWMPIIVYFMKRDLFFLWCTHFVFASGSNNMWVINDRQNTNYGRTVSFNKNTWVNELK